MYNGCFNNILDKIVKKYEDKTKVSYNEERDLADLSKFLIFEKDCNEDDIIFFCDDDLVFEEYYCEEMIRCLNDNEVVSIGGKVLSEQNMEATDSYMRIFSERHTCFKIDNVPTNVDVPLSGACAFRFGAIKNVVIDESFKYAADIFFFKLCIERKIKIAKYTTDFSMLKYNTKMKDVPTIWSDHTSKQDTILGSFVKKIYNEYR